MLYRTLFTCQVHPVTFENRCFSFTPWRLSPLASACSICVSIDHLAFDFVATWCLTVLQHMDRNGGTCFLMSNSPALQIGSKLKYVYDLPGTWSFGLLIRSDVILQHVDRNGGTCFLMSNSPALQIGSKLKYVYDLPGTWSLGLFNS